MESAKRKRPTPPAGNTGLYPPPTPPMSPAPLKSKDSTPKKKKSGD